MEPKARDTQPFERAADRAADAAADNANRTMNTAADKAEGIADYLRSRDAQSIADDAKAKAAQVAETTQEKAQQVGAQASEKIDAATTATGRQMNNLAQTVRENAPQGKLGDVATATAGALERGGNYLQRADVETMRSDLETIIRRRPIESLLVGLGFGYLLARSMRR